MKCNNDKNKASSGHFYSSRKGHKVDFFEKYIAFHVNKKNKTNELDLDV